MRKTAYHMNVALQYKNSYDVILNMQNEYCIICLSKLARIDF